VPDRVTTLETQVGELRTDIVALRQEMRTGFADVNMRLDAMVTREDLAASHLVTRDDLAGFATRDDLARFATRDDLAGFATRDDLARFATRDDLAGFATRDDLARFATRDDLAALRTEMRVLHEDVIERIKTLGEALNGGRSRRKRR